MKRTFDAGQVDAGVLVDPDAVPNDPERAFLKRSGARHQLQNTHTHTRTHEHTLNLHQDRSDVCTSLTWPCPCLSRSTTHMSTMGPRLVKVSITATNEPWSLLSTFSCKHTLL